METALQARGHAFYGVPPFSLPCEPSTPEPRTRNPATHPLQSVPIVVSVPLRLKTTSDLAWPCVRTGKMCTFFTSIFVKSLLVLGLLTKNMHLIKYEVYIPLHQILQKTSCPKNSRKRMYTFCLSHDSASVRVVLLTKLLGRQQPKRQDFWP